MQRKDDFFVFISFSDSPSKEISLELKKLLEGILTLASDIVFFLSETDIDRGETGQDVLEKALAKADFGILILTENNIRSQWLMYEAGAITKHTSMDAQDSEGKYHTVIDRNRVCPIFFARENIDFEDFKSPIFAKQRIKYQAGKGQFLELLFSIYKAKYGKLTEKQEKALEKGLNGKWNDFSQKVDELLKVVPIRLKKLMIFQIRENYRN
jgi:hypothetical protein